MADKSTNRKINIWINGRQVTNTYKGITDSMRKARNELAHMTIGSKKYLEQTQKIKKLQGIMDAHRSKQGQIATGWKRIRNEFKSATLSFFAGNVLTSVVQNMGSAISGLVTGAASLSDQLADIQKTTGLTAKEVDDLNGSLSKIDTRTPTSELRNLAFIAGKLGKKSKEDVLEFVGATDKLVVALGEDLGGLDAIKQLGKLNELFKIEEVYGTAEAFMKTGSAINSLGAASVASEEYLVAFTQRFGGLAENANISMQDVLGLAATMDILGKKQEVASSSMAKFLIALGDKKGIAKFAKMAGLSVKEYSKLLETDANEAMLKVLEGAKSTKQGVAGLSATLENLGINGVQAAQVLPALASNIDLLREQQALANSEFEKGTSLTEEYNIKNENLAAKLDKLAKKMRKLWMNADVKNAIEGLVDVFSRFIDMVAKNTKYLKIVAKSFVVATTAVITYNIALKAGAFWTKLLAVWNRKAAIASNLLRKANLLAAFAQAKLTGNIKRAAAAQRALNLSMNMNPIAAILGLLAAAGTAFLMFKDQVKEATEKQVEFNKAQVEMQEIMSANKSLDEQFANIAGMNKRQLTSFVDKTQSELGRLQDIRLKISTENKELVDNWKSSMKRTGASQKQISDFVNKQISQIFFRKTQIADEKQRFKELESFMLKANERLNKINKKDKNKKDLSSSTGKAETDKLKAFKQKYEQLRKTILDIRRKFNLSDLSEEEKASQQTFNKYDDQLNIVDGFIKEIEEQADKRGFIKDDEFELLSKFYDQRNQLAQLKEEELLQIEIDFAKKREAEKKKLQSKIDEILMDETQKEIHQVTKKYSDLIDKAKEFGISTVELYKKMNAEIEAIKNSDEAPTDIFGMSDEDWEKFFEQVNKAMVIAGELGDIVGFHNQKLSNEENAKLDQYEKHSDKKKKSLEDRLEAGVVSEKYYNSQIAVIDAQLDKERSRIAAKQAKREQDMQKFSAKMNLLSGLVQIWSSSLGKPGGVIYAGILSALLLTKTKKQIDAINSAPIPAFAAGARVNKPTTALIGEAGPEIVLSSSIVKSKSLGPIADDLARVQEGKQPRFLGRPQTPNFGGMEKAIAGKSGNAIISNTVINQVDTEGTKQMQEKIELMNANIEEMTRTIADLKYLRAVITDDDLTEHEEEKSLRLKYSSF